MTPDERRNAIDKFSTGYHEVIAALEDCPHAMWHFKSAPDRWSIHEIIIHLADSEANAYIRFRRCIAEPGTTLSVYDQDKWATELQYATQDTDEALELFRILRVMTTHVLRTAPDAAWENKVTHLDWGSIALDRILKTYVDHVDGHIQQMEGNLTAWKAQHPA